MCLHHIIWYKGFDIQYLIPTCWLDLLKVVKQHIYFVKKRGASLSLLKEKSKSPCFYPMLVFLSTYILNPKFWINYKHYIVYVKFYLPKNLWRCFNLSMYIYIPQMTRLTAYLYFVDKWFNIQIKLIRHSDYNQWQLIIDYDSTIITDNRLWLRLFPIIDYDSTIMITHHY
jgi:hypothetical protein